MDPVPMHEFALVVGKFCPLHAGHLHLIERTLAAARCVCVLSYTSLVAPRCDAAHRRAWLEACLRPHADRLSVHVLEPDGCPSDEADADVHRRFCADRMRAWGYAIDMVSTSEGYGDGFAQVLGHELGRRVDHLCLDPARGDVPISGTKARALFDGFCRDPDGDTGRACLAELRLWLPEPVFHSLVAPRGDC
jgi:HTH-type transcriptional repressor of NAD biosynthesis genes